MPSHRTKLLPSVLACLLLSATTVLAQRGAIVNPASLEELTDRAQTIVRARVLSAHIEPHPQLSNLQTVVLTLAVKEAYKGNPAATMTIRQFIWDIRDKIDSMGYRKGQEYILFLNPPTKYGLTSTTGLDQGRFQISKDPSGNEVITNNAASPGLLTGSTTVEWAGKKPSRTARSPIVQTSPPKSTPALPSGEVRVTDFVSVIKSYASSK